jgi:hypothetical protein
MCALQPPAAGEPCEFRDSEIESTPIV